MKDRQPGGKGPQQRIPFLSAILHWMALPVIVFLRSGFGYSFLSPKSVFLAFIYAQTLFLIYALKQPGVLPRYGFLVAFMTAASALYLIHLAVAFHEQTLRSAKHDHFSGTPYLLRIVRLFAKDTSGNLETFVLLWLEPIFVGAVVVVLNLFFHERTLSGWLMWVVPAMWLKEFLNYWYELRHEKKETDIQEDAEGKMNRQAIGADVPLPNPAGRKRRVARSPATREGDDDRVQERRHAEVLRLLPPYTLDQAEKNYRLLAKESHTSPGGADEERLRELNEAIGYFRLSLAAS